MYNNLQVISYFVLEYYVYFQVFVFFSFFFERYHVKHVKINKNCTTLVLLEIWKLQKPPVLRSTSVYSVKTSAKDHRLYKSVETGTFAICPTCLNAAPLALWDDVSRKCRKLSVGLKWLTRRCNRNTYRFLLLPGHTQPPVYSQLLRW